MKQNEKGKLLGILGGLGPMATAYFYELLTAFTIAERDQDHIDMVISSRVSTPDRSSFILGTCHDNPLPVMIEEAKKLEAYGADLIAIPCNTAHYFYDGIAKETGIPVLNIISETVGHLHLQGVKRAALFATEGTCKSGTYQNIGKGKVDIIVPEAEDQDVITSIIFDEIKSGKEPDIEKFISLATKMRERGCERVILGCTELSLIKKDYDIIKHNDFYTDSLTVLAKATVSACGKPCRDQI
ncbi:MAG: amino acid racemase [Clostridia bacterium]|nr:amino acid racemase [Clostridia bacterium]